MRECKKKHKWGYCGNGFYCCVKCGIMRTAQEVNLYEEKDQKIAELRKTLELLSNKNNYYLFVNENTATINVDLAKQQAKEMLKNEPNN